MDTPAPKFLNRTAKPAIAYRTIKGDPNAPGFVWLGGYGSAMIGGKADSVSHWAEQQNRSFTRFDYSGHGESEGDFEGGCISDWCEDAAFAIENLTQGPIILAGSSMGAWIACHMINRFPQRVKGFVGIAPAPDFVTELAWPSFSSEIQSKIMKEGKVTFPSPYDDSVTVYTKRLIEDGRECRVLTDPIHVDGPVHLLQGSADDDVPWEHAKRLADHITAPEVTLTLVKDGDHRLSTPRDIERLLSTLSLYL